jgi:phage repressor protein C with HTH and peptisase S24 domain
LSTIACDLALSVVFFVNDAAMIDGRYFLIDGEKLREFRRTVLGEFIGFSEPMIRVIEQTKAHRLQITRALQVATAMGIQLRQLELYFSGPMRTGEMPERNLSWVKEIIKGLERNRRVNSEERSKTQEKVSVRQIPFFDVKIPASGWADSIASRTVEQADGFELLDESVPADAFALRIEGDCMEPSFPSGSVVVFAPVHPGDGPSPKFTSGKPHYFEHTDGKSTFKLVFYEPPKARYRLECINEKYKPMFVPEQLLARMSRAVRVVMRVP